MDHLFFLQKEALRSKSIKNSKNFMRNYTGGGNTVIHFYTYNVKTIDTFTSGRLLLEGKINEPFCFQNA